MARILEILSDAVSNLKSLYGERFDNPDVHRKVRDCNTSDVPRIVYGGSKLGPIRITKEIDLLISKIALKIKKQDNSMSMCYTDKEFISLTRQKFGESLGKINLREDSAKGAQIIYDSIKTEIEQSVNLAEEREYVYGCNLFSNTQIDSFEIGPVRFEKKYDWLNRKVSDHHISNIAERRILRAWSGEQVRDRQPSPDAALERGILKAIDSCPYVCSVRTNSLGSEAGSEKAAVVARLSLTSIALLWDTPSRVLEAASLHQDRNFKQLVNLYFSPNKLTLPGLRNSHFPHGPEINNEEWVDLVKNNLSLFRTTEEVVGYYLNPAANSRRGRLVTALTHSLLWFREACREPMTLISIVKFAASLDSLANGSGVEGIYRVLDSRLNMPKNSEIFSGGPTVKSTIQKIYSQARSVTIHGTNDKLGIDWSQTRYHAEWFARYSLVSCLNWAHENPTENDPRQLQS